MKREVKLGSHTRSELDCLSLQVSAAGFPDCVFVALFRIAVKTIKEQVAECRRGLLFFFFRLRARPPWV